MENQIKNILETNNKLPFRSQCDLDEVAEGVQYAIIMLNNIIEYKKCFSGEMILQNEIIKTIHNAFLESSLYHIRKLYEFFFNYDHYGMKRDRTLKTFKEWSERFDRINNFDDICAEFYFNLNDPEVWYKIKNENKIYFRDYEKLISFQKLNKNAMHFTNKGKITWKEIPEVVLKLNHVNEIFFNSVNLKRNFSYNKKCSDDQIHNQTENTIYSVTLPFISQEQITPWKKE